MKRYSSDIIVKNLKTLMSLSGDTYHSLSQKTKINPSVFSKFFSGKHTLTLETLIILATHYKVSLDWLILNKSTDNEATLHKQISELQVKYDQMKHTAETFRKSLLEILQANKEVYSPKILEKKGV